MIIRAAQPADMTFLRHSWASSMSKGAMRYLMPPVQRPEAGEDALRSALLRHVDRLLARAAVLVAEVEGQIVGWVCYAKGAAHYVYVKQLYRGNGVAKALLERAGLGGARTVCTHYTAACEKYGERLDYRPSMLWAKESA